ncbi:MAG: hypothetical protein EOO61_11315, partial [Hymenobacter sp.]
MYLIFKRKSCLQWVSCVCYLPLVLLLTTCHKKQAAEHSFYYWKTTFDYDTVKDTALVKKLQVQHFYIRYLDVDWSENMNMPVPVGELSGINYSTCKPYTSHRYTPVVFITNRTFQHITDAWCDTLATRLSKKINSLTADIEKAVEDDALWGNPAISEYQFAHRDSVVKA